jgi:uncharacterized protein (DUF2235 family)
MTMFEAIIAFVFSWAFIAGLFVGLLGGAGLMRNSKRANAAWDQLRERLDRAEAEVRRLRERKGE